MKLIEFMPIRFGQQFYAMGSPLDQDVIIIGDYSIRELYQQHLEGKSDPESEEYIKGFLLYYMNAPCWSIDSDRDWGSLTIDELLDICWWNGLDPL